MAVAWIFKKVLFRTHRLFSPLLNDRYLLYFKYLICIFTVHLYRPLCLIVSSLTCSALGCLLNMWTFRPPPWWAHGLLWWPRTAINNAVFCLVKSLSLLLHCLSEIKFTATTGWTSLPWGYTVYIIRIYLTTYANVLLYFFRVWWYHRFFFFCYLFTQIFNTAIIAGLPQSKWISIDDYGQK